MTQLYWRYERAQASSAESEFPEPTPEEIENFKDAFRVQFKAEPEDFDVNSYVLTRTLFGTQEQRKQMKQGCEYPPSGKS